MESNSASTFSTIIATIASSSTSSTFLRVQG